MRYILAHNHKKPLVPISYSTIQSFLKTLQSKQTGIAKAVISHAQKLFLPFGWELVEMKSGMTPSISRGAMCLFSRS
jgi:hypothetical protein